MRACVRSRLSSTAARAAKGRLSAGACAVRLHERPVKHRFKAFIVSTKQYHVLRSEGLEGASTPNMCVRPKLSSAWNECEDLLGDPCKSFVGTRRDGAHCDETVIHALERAQLDFHACFTQSFRIACTVARKGIALCHHHHSWGQVDERLSQQGSCIGVGSGAVGICAKVLLPEPLHRPGCEPEPLSKIRVAAARHGVIVAGVG
jgi:hypothetical protein